LLVPTTSAIFYDSSPTPDFSRRPRMAFNQIFRKIDDSHAIGRSAGRTCSAAASKVPRIFR
jgi:hypothetical protein